MSTRNLAAEYITRAIAALRKDQPSVDEAIRLLQLAVTALGEGEAVGQRYSPLLDALVVRASVMGIRGIVDDRPRILDSVEVVQSWFDQGCQLP